VLSGRLWYTDAEADAAHYTDTNARSDADPHAGPDANANACSYTNTNARSDADTSSHAHAYPRHANASANAHSGADPGAFDNRYQPLVDLRRSCDSRRRQGNGQCRQRELAGSERRR